MLLAPSGPPVAVKRRAVNLPTKSNSLYVILFIFTAFADIAAYDFVKKLNACAVRQ
jgi:hypothetical protein